MRKMGLNGEKSEKNRRNVRGWRIGQKSIKTGQGKWRKKPDRSSEPDRPGRPPKPGHLNRSLKNLPPFFFDSFSLLSRLRPSLAHRSLSAHRNPKSTLSSLNPPNPKPPYPHPQFSSSPSTHPATTDKRQHTNPVGLHRHCPSKQQIDGREVKRLRV